MRHPWPEPAHQGRLSVGQPGGSVPAPGSFQAHWRQVDPVEKGLQPVGTSSSSKTETKKSSSMSKDGVTVITKFQSRLDTVP